MESFKFRSKVAISNNGINISHDQPILLIGSCFSESIGEKLTRSKFWVNNNPFGIIYNPISITKSIDRIINNSFYGETEIISILGKYVSLDHHGSFSATSKDECLSRINKSLSNAHSQLSKVKTLIVTFGSSWVYEYTGHGIVANCHKIPITQFKKRLLTVEEIVTSFKKVLSQLHTYFPKMDIIFTVSPVRHVKDGLHENNISKSVLFLAINKLLEQNDNCSYFPSYELIIDELRDYRFFKDDLVHPSKMAINYVWKNFIETYCKQETIELIAEIEKIKQAVNHRPFSYNSEEHQRFIKTRIQIMDELSKKYVWLNFEGEKKQITSF